jgi:hypothetical protein
MNLTDAETAMAVEALRAHAKVLVNVARSHGWQGEAYKSRRDGMRTTARAMTRLAGRLEDEVIDSDPRVTPLAKLTRNLVNPDVTWHNRDND